MNTAASLLALMKHSSIPLEKEKGHFPTKNYSRLTLATESLKKLLSSWDVSTFNHVEFEILVPSLLALLEDHGIKFDFPGRNHLITEWRTGDRLIDHKFSVTDHLSTLRTTAIELFSTFSYAYYSQAPPSS